MTSSHNHCAALLRSDLIPHLRRIGSFRLFCSFSPANVPGKTHLEFVFRSGKRTVDVRLIGERIQERINKTRIDIEPVVQQSELPAYVRSCAQCAETIACIEIPALITCF